MFWLTVSQLRLSALNSTKTGFASFTFEKEVFFEAYSFNSSSNDRSGSVSLERFFCQIYNKVSIDFSLLELYPTYLLVIFLTLC